jgi:hypothetical protein
MGEYVNSCSDLIRVEYCLLAAANGHLKVEVQPL